MTSDEEAYEGLARMIFEWAARMTDADDVVANVVHDIRAWVSEHECMPRLFATVAVACLKEVMELTAVAQSGSLIVAQEGSWVIESMTGPHCREPDAVATMQTAIALLNRDTAMAHDLLVAHERAGGPTALVDVGLVATSMIASFVEVEEDA